MFKGYGFISPFPSLYMDKLFSCLCLSVTVCVNCTYSSLFPCICTECLLKNCLLEFILFPILWERCAIKMLMMKISVPLWESFSVSEFNGQLVDMTPCFWLVYKTLQSGFHSVKPQAFESLAQLQLYVSSHPNIVVSSLIPHKHYIINYSMTA